MRPLDRYAEIWQDAQRRRRLVRLCAVMSGDAESAEDLAQETLLEAWRHADKLVDESGLDRWLAAIARHVCRRWSRRRGRDVVSAAPLDDRIDAPAEIDVERELERSELIDLLDRALSSLPAKTRGVLVQRFVLESPHAEIAARLGITEDAVSMRITRGKLVLRRALVSALGPEAADFGFGAEDEWLPTRVWCTGCGRERLHIRRDADVISFRCTRCSREAPQSEYALTNSIFAGVAGVIRPSAILARGALAVHRYFGAGASQATCARCGRGVTIHTVVRHDLKRGAGVRGLAVKCPACGEEAWCATAGLALSAPEVRAFRRAHPRIASVAERDIDRDGAPASLVTFEDVESDARLGVVLARDTLRVLDVAASR